MLGAGIHLQILHNGFAKARFGEHAFDSLLDEKRRFLRQVIGRRSETLTSRETGVSCVDLVVIFLPVSFTLSALMTIT